MKAAPVQNRSGFRIFVIMLCPNQQHNFMSFFFAVNNRLSNLRLAVAVICFAVILTNGCSAPDAATRLRTLLPALPNYPTVAIRSIPYPIILLHGLGQKADVWNESAVGYYKKELGLHFGGQLIAPNGKCSLKPSGDALGDFFTASFSNPVDSVNGWVQQLEKFIPIVLERTKAQKVILIGYSMGGLAARTYLTRHIKDHKVQRLITIGTPHQGSALAKVWKWKTAVKSLLAGNPNIIARTAVQPLLSVIEAAEQDVPFNSPAVRDLMRPQDGGKFIAALNNAEHPLDVEYISVVGAVDILREVKELNTSAAQELFRRLLSVIGFGPEALFESGDGVVSVASQTINEIPWFKQNLARQRISRTVTLGSVHTEHLRNSAEIQKITLEDKPEFKGAEFYVGNNGKPTLLIEFSDLLPPSLCEISASFRDKDGNKRGITIPRGNAILIQKPDGTTVSAAMVEFPTEMSFEQNIAIEFTVKNSFGNIFTSSKQWTWMHI